MKYEQNSIAHALLTKLGRRISLPKNTSLPFENVYYLVEGHCALVAYTPQGKEYSVLHFKPGMILNFLPAILNTQEFHPFTKARAQRNPPFVITRTRCTFSMLHKDQFMQAVRDQDKMHELLMHALAENCLNLIAHIVNVNSLPADARVCELLLSYAGDVSPYTIPPYLTYAEIGHYLALHVITVTKIFRALREQGIIHKEKRVYSIIDIQRLRRIVLREEILEY